jgi:putative transposase
LLGDEAFVKQHPPPSHQTLSPTLREVSKAHRRALALPLARYETDYPERDLTMAQAYQSGAYTMPQIAAHFGVLTMAVSRAVRKGGAGGLIAAADSTTARLALHETRG